MIWCLGRTPCMKVFTSSEARCDLDFCIHRSPTRSLDWNCLMNLWGISSDKGANFVVETPRRDFVLTILDFIFLVYRRVPSVFSGVCLVNNLTWTSILQVVRRRRLVYQWDLLAVNVFSEHFFSRRKGYVDAQCRMSHTNWIRYVICHELHEQVQYAWAGLSHP